MRQPFEWKHWSTQYPLAEGATQLEYDNSNRVVNYYNVLDELVWSRPYDFEEEIRIATEAENAATDVVVQERIAKESEFEAIVKPELEAARDEVRLFVQGAPEALSLAEIYSGMLTSLENFSDNPVGDEDPGKTVGQIHSRSIEWLFGVVQQQQAQLNAQGALIAALGAKHVSSSDALDLALTEVAAVA